MKLKESLIKAIIESLNKDLQALVHSALEAKEAATNPESKAENKYDTRGLESSYLAASQAKRASELKEVISHYSLLKLSEFSKDTPIQVTALVQCLVDDKESVWYFLIPQKGGIKITLDAREYTTISVQSPIGQKLMQKMVGDTFEVPLKDRIKEYEIKQVI